MASVALGRRAQRIISGTTEWLVRVHDARTARPLQVLRGHRKVVHAVACSPFHDVFASGSDEGLLRLGRVSDGTWIKTLQRKGAQIWAAHFADRGRVLWIACNDGALRSYRIRDGKLLAHIRVATSPLMSMDIHGRLIATGGGDGTVRIVNMRTRRVVQTLTGHDQTAYGVDFHPSGKWLASGSADWSVRIWDLATGTTTQKLESFGNCVSAVAWSPDGSLAVGCAGGSLHLLGTKSTPKPKDD